MIKLLKSLCQVDAISGDESAMIKKVISFLPSKCKYTIDSQNNLIVFKKGKKTPRNKLLLTAHRDEVGLIVTNVLDDGYLTFDTVGGIEVSSIAGKRVKIGNIYGTVNLKPIHLQDKEERKEKLNIKNLVIDIGATSKKEALKYVSLGQSVSFSSNFCLMGDQKIKAKAIDDRFGCANLIKILNEYDEYDLSCAFLAKEEIGLIGAKVAAYRISPAYSIVFDATSAADLPNIDKKSQVCALDKGPVIPFMDKGTIYDKSLYDLTLDLANKNNIQTQTKTKIAGANDSSAISTSKSGVKTVSISLACRYIHSPCCVASINDIKQAHKLSILVTNAISSLN